MIDDILEEKSEENSSDSEEKDISRKDLAIDGSVDIIIDPDYTIAHIKLHAHHFGGKHVTFEDVMSALKEKEVKYGIDEKEIKRAIKNKSFGELIAVAEWTPPVDGENGSIEYLMPQNKEIKPKRDEFGIVDFRDLGHIVPVSKGDKIANITPETIGTDGMNLKGIVIKAVAGRAPKFKIGKNTGVTTDGLSLVSLKDGHIFYSLGCFVVEEVVTVMNDVDISVGNIIYDGDVLVKGDVCEGFKVISKKSVTINGNIMGGEIIADGNIIIKNGCINSTLTAGGLIKIGFCENSKLKSGNDIESKAFISCIVDCGGELRAMGNNGIIKGGKYTSQKNVVSPIVGSENYCATEIYIGDNSVLIENKNNALKELKKEQDIFENSSKNIEYLRNKKSSVGIITSQQEITMKKETQTKLQAQVKIKHWKNFLSEIEESYQNKDKLCLKCQKQLYPGTKVYIHHIGIEIKDPYSRSKVVLNDNEAIVMPI